MAVWGDSADDWSSATEWCIRLVGAVLPWATLFATLAKPRFFDNHLSLARRILVLAVITLPMVRETAP